MSMESGDTITEMSTRNMPGNLGKSLLNKQTPEFGLGNLWGERALDKDILSASLKDGVAAGFSVDELSKVKDNASGSGFLGAYDSIGGLSGLGTIAGLGLDVMGIMNQNKALKQAEKAWKAENTRANEIMAMKREQYDTFKKDKSALNAGYSGETKVG